MIRIALESDLPRIAEIQVFGWRNAYIEIISNYFLFKELAVDKRLLKLQNEWGKTTTTFYVNDDNGIVNGFMNIGKCRDNDKQESYELCAIYVEPLFIKKGIGKRLVNECECIAREKGCSENVLWVFKENYEAIKFYEKLGYKADGKEQEIEKFKTIEIRYSKVIGKNG